jgi:glucose-6-phosphate 1-dehydrogenase
MNQAHLASCDFIIFGGTGDLSVRKLLPSLLFRDRDSQLGQDTRIILVSRASGNTQEVIDLTIKQMKTHLGGEAIDKEIWTKFLKRLFFMPIDALGEKGWSELKDFLGHSKTTIRIFYLATGPDLFESICQKLASHGLNSHHSRVVVEKPIGHDLESALHVNEGIGKIFKESQIFRVDHYLGKEAVQNLLALRFANAIFESVWNRSAIDHVQITVAESVGVDTRGSYYDKSGALRDMLQNHMIQLLCLIAMEPPEKFNPDDIRDAKLRVLRALKPIEHHSISSMSVRGQYRSGNIEGKVVQGYQEDIGGHTSRTETFVALKVEIENWRWAGVPFYLRTGKRLQERKSEIVIQFRPVPHNIFSGVSGDVAGNRLVVRLQPNEGIKLHLMSKDPGPGAMRLRSSALNITYADAFHTRYLDAYERLLMDVVAGNTTLFMRRDEVEAAWRWIMPLIDGWENSSELPRPYSSGSWGPSAAIALIERDGRTWHEEVE